MISKTVVLAGITTIATTVASNTIAQTHQIFWDSSNDLFQSERKPTKQVRLGDRLDFTCGHDTNLGNAYLVNDLHSFENCDSSSRRVLFNCEKAGTKKTIKILEVNPHPFAPIFLAGEDYYLVGGSCAHENLRMVIRVDAEVSSDGLARVVTEEIEIEQPEMETIYPETPRVVIPMLTTNSESLSEEPDFSANNTQLNQLLIGVALGVLIFLILVFSSILIYLKFCGAKNKSKKNKVNDVENSSESGIGYTFKQAPVINTIPSFTKNENNQLYKFNNYEPDFKTDFKTDENVQSLITKNTKKSYVPPSLVKTWFMYQNRENLQNFQNPNFSNNQYLQTMQHQNQNQQQFHSQTIQNHYQSQFRKPKATTQTYTNMPVSRQMVGEPSMTGNAFLSIAKRVDPAYAHDLSQEISQEISHNYTVQQEYNQTNNFVQNKFDSIDSGKNNSQNESSRGSSEPLINASRDVGYEGSQEVASSPETESSQISPQSGFKPSCQPRLENGGLVISV